MPTNEERIIAAARLRNYDNLRESFKKSPICGFINALGFGGYLDWEDVCNRIADLIEPEPERTFRIKQHRCTNCDHEINDRAYFAKVVLDDGCWTAESHNANYCPSCGAKVVQE